MAWPRLIVALFDVETSDRTSSFQYNSQVPGTHVKKFAYAKPESSRLPLSSPEETLRLFNVNVGTRRHFLRELRPTGFNYFHPT